MNGKQKPVPKTSEIGCRKNPKKTLPIDIHGADTIRHNSWLAQELFAEAKINNLDGGIGI
jgi:hypothetical protein